VELRRQPPDRRLRPRAPEGRRRPVRPRERRGDRGDAKKDDEKDAKAADAKKGDGKDAKKDEAKAPKPVVIDWDGLAGRVVRVPVEAENLDGLEATKTALLYTKEGASFYGRDSDRESSLVIFDLKEREASDLVADVDGWALSHDGSKVLVRGGGKEKGFKLWDVKPKAKEPKSVSTKELAVDRVPAEEWTNAFDEVWRRYRDFFYVRNMHGYDWKAIGERYRALLPHVSHRSDLTYLLGEMVAELNVGHAYVEEGDIERPARAKVGLPGARFELDPKAGLYRIARLFRGHNEEPRYRAPLTEVGVDARVGDYVLAVDGEELKGDDNPYRLLQHKTHPVTLTLSARPTAGRSPEGDLPAGRERGEPPLPRLGARQRGEGLEALERPRRLPARPRHGGAGDLRVPQVVLPADPEGGARRRRPLERRRERLAVDPREARLEAPRDPLRLLERAPDDVSVRGLPRPPGRPHQRDVGVGR
jgi:Uncharacterized protein related to the periplasmic component of the Tol biopolymer transport system